MIFIHNLNPVAFEVFSIKIYWYSLAYIFGFFWVLCMPKSWLIEFTALLNLK